MNATQAREITDSVRLRTPKSLFDLMMEYGVNKDAANGKYKTEFSLEVTPFANKRPEVIAAVAKLFRDEGFCVQLIDNRGKKHDAVDPEDFHTITTFEVCWS